MPFLEPSWWYDGRRWPGLLLQPLAAVYGFVASRRLHRAPVASARLPVVCVGNFTAGGTGKTPVSIFIANQLAALGLRPVFLTRGYGAIVATPTLVDLSRHGSLDVGDEALLLARHGPVMVAADRAAGASAIAQFDIAADVIIMDDGLQNPRLAKDIAIAVVDGARGVGNGRVIPAGPLRAPLDDQIAHVDAVIFNGSGLARELLEELVSACAKAKVLRCAAVADDVVGGDAGSGLRSRRVLAFCGIGNPERFRTLLRQLGADVALWRTFADHHAYSERDAAQLLEEADRLGLSLITTEKDHVRLGGFDDSRGRLARRALVLPITVKFQDDDGGRLIELIAERIERRRHGSASRSAP